MPPVLFDELVQATVDDEVIRQKINDLIALKRQSKGNDNKDVDADLVDFAHNLAEHFEQTIPDFRPDINHTGDSSDLDELLREMALR